MRGLEDLLAEKMPDAGWCLKLDSSMHTLYMFGTRYLGSS